MSMMNKKEIIDWCNSEYEELLYQLKIKNYSECAKTKTIISTLKTVLNEKR